MKLLIAICLLFAATLNAQVNQDWAERYNGTGNSYDVAAAVALDDSGNVYVTGQSVGTNSNFDCVTIKYDPQGNEVWNQRYDAPGNSNDESNAIAVDKSGNVYITGETGIFGGNRDYLTIKYNSSGIQQWANTYNGPGNSSDAASSIAVDDSGNVYITGFSWGSGTITDYATIKYDSVGAQKWVKRYNGPGNIYDVPSSIATDDSGNVYVTGESIGAGTNYDFATIKYNHSGIERWVQRYHNNGTSNERASSLYVDEQRNVYVTGSSDGDGTGADYVTVLYNSHGQEQWLKKYNGPGNNADIPNSIIADGVGNVFVTGFSADTLGGQLDVDYATVKYNSAGMEQWIRRYDGTADSTDYAYSIAADTAGNVYVTGESSGNGTGADYATIKYNSAGQEQWIKRYNGPGNGVDQSWDIAIDAGGNVYVTGASVGNGTESDFTTIKYSQSSTAIKNNPEISIDDFELSQNYPNPFNPTTTIQYAIGGRQFVSLKVYDILGREVATLVNEEKPAGEYAVEFDGSSLSSGIYVYQLKAGENFTQTRKSILMR